MYQICTPETYMVLYVNYTSIKNIVMNSKKKENFLNPIEGKRGKRNSSSNEQA